MTSPPEGDSSIEVAFAAELSTGVCTNDRRGPSVIRLPFQAASSKNDKSTDIVCV